MSIQSPLKLFVGGCSMITSCSVWLFESKIPALSAASIVLTDEAMEPINQESNNTDIQPTETISQAVQSPAPQQTPSSQIYLDQLPKVDQLSNRKGTELKNEKIKLLQKHVNTGIDFSLEDAPEKGSLFLSLVQQELDDFSTLLNNTKEAYEKFDKKTIRISLFNKPAWYSENNIDEYQDAMSYDQFSELFEGTDEVRVKQLLLSLNLRVEWKNTGANNRFYSEVRWLNDINDLTDLKIKHFKDFNKLKDYVKAKVATCTTDERSCVPTVGELDYMDTDTKAYFENIWNSQNT